MALVDTLETYVADVLGERSRDRDELDTAVKIARLLLESTAYLSLRQIGAAQDTPPQEASA